MGFEGSCERRGFKGKGGGVRGKLKGWSPKDSSKFCSDSICNNIFLFQTAYQNAKDQRF